MRCLIGAVLVVAATGAMMAPTRAAELSVTLTFLGKAEPPVQPLSLVEPVLTDEGLKGAQQAIQDNQTTGRFLEHEYQLVERVVPADGDVGAVLQEAIAAGERLFVADLATPDLLAVTAEAERAGAIVFNGRSEDVELRVERCSPAVFHTAPDRAMKADALAQYLVAKRWLDWVLIAGSLPADRAFAAAVERAAERFGAEIVEQRTVEYTPGARRTDTGAQQIQQQIAILTQGMADHDVVIVADESEMFGEYVPYRTWDPRPVMGTAGLVPTAWSRAHEQWGGTQMQRRFERFAGRSMTERDYGAWLAVRSVGEAVTRAQTADAMKLRDYLRSDAFEVAAFKGEGLTFRLWDQQMRQPILLASARVLVGSSPQDQFLHQRTPLDTLGYDEPDSRCRLS